MKNVLITILILMITAVIILYFWAKNLLKKLSFDVKIDFSKLNFVSIGTELAGLELPVIVSVLNKSEYELNVKQLDIELYYQGVLFSQTIEKYDVKIEKQAITIYSFIFYVQNNATTRQLIKDYLKGQELNIDLKANFRVLNGTIRLTYNQQIKITKQ